MGLPLAAPGRALAAGGQQIMEKVPVTVLAYDYQAAAIEGCTEIPADLYQTAVQPRAISSLHVELEYSVGGQQVTRAVTYDLAEMPAFETA